METLHVARMRTRYRLPAGGGDSRARLDRVLREVLEDGLESALARSGVATHEEVCIRSAHAAVSLAAAGNDATLVATWSVALADSIRRAIQEGGPDVVRYATRNHALVDLLVGVAFGDLRRAWAWRQLDLWRSSDSPSPEAAAAEAARALLAHPEAAVAALSGAARSGALPRLALALPPAAWAEIARAALRAASVDPQPVLHALDVAAVEALHAGAPGSAHSQALAGDATEDRTRLTRAVARITRASAIAMALGEMGHEDVAARRLLALLALLEADPGELRRGAANAARLARRVESETRRAEMPDVADGLRSHDYGSPSVAGMTTTTTPAHAGAQDDRTDPDRLASEKMLSRPYTAPTRGILDDASPAADAEPPAATPAGAPDDRAGAEEEERPLPELRASAATEWGGLLFLLHVVGELGIPAEIAAADVFRARSTRWVLHGLALRLLELDERDPAALAFAGLAPDAMDPGVRRGDDRPSDSESDAIAALALRVAVRTFERLGGEAPEDERAALAAVRTLARRRAEIAAEPGWVDVMLRLDEVSVDVRRAGLDLDPGWIPWLGMVVRFVYG